MKHCNNIYLILGGRLKEKNLQKLKKNVVYVRKNNLNNIVYKETYQQNIIIFMGAGSITYFANNLVKDYNAQ